MYLAVATMRDTRGELRRETMGHRKVKWGVLSTAAIGVRKVIPAMQLGDWSEIVAIASRDGKKAESVARQLRIPKLIGRMKSC